MFSGPSTVIDYFSVTGVAIFFLKQPTLSQEAIISYVLSLAKKSESTTESDCCTQQVIGLEMVFEIFSHCFVLYMCHSQ